MLGDSWAAWEDSSGWVRLLAASLTSLSSSQTRASCVKRNKKAASVEHLLLTLEREDLWEVFRQINFIAFEARLWVLCSHFKCVEGKF